MSSHQPLGANRKKEPKTPPSFYMEENYMDEAEERAIMKPAAKTSQNRPQSAKPNNAKISKSPNKPIKRPSSAKKQPPKARTPVKPNHDADIVVPAKQKLGRTSMDKEKIYEENIALKLQLNMSNEELIKYKTKISQLEKEIKQKREYFAEELKNADKYTPNNLKYANLVSNLRQSVKDHKKELAKKDNEISSLKKSIKNTKGSELEIEIQAYIDECTRLRHHLEELIRERELPQGTSDDHHAIVKNLKKENKDLNLLMGQIKTEALHWKERAEKLEKLKKKSISSKDDPEALLAEISHLKSQLENSGQASSKKDGELKKSLEQLQKELNDAKNKLVNAEKTIKEQNKTIEKFQGEQKKNQGLPLSNNLLDNPNKLLATLNRIIKKKRIDIDTLLSQLDRNKKGSLELDEIVKGCKVNGEEISGTHVKEAILEFTGIPIASISLHQLRIQYERYNYRGEDDPISSEDEVNFIEEVKITKEAFALPSKEVKQASSPPIKEAKQAPTPPPKDLAKPKQEISPLKTADKKSSENQISTVKLDQVTNILRHISFRMQLHRLPKDKLSSALFDEKQKNDKPITYQELALIFSKKPFGIEEKSEAILLAKFLVEPEGTENITESQYKQLKSTPKQIAAKFSKVLEDWELFSLEDEEEFDKEIAILIGSTYDHLYESCKKYDKNRSGVINSSEFNSALKELGIDIPTGVYNYMQLLFYSHNNQLDSVPYEQFLNAYIDQGEEGEHSDYSEEEQAKIVRHYLTMIAQNLSKMKKTTRSVFRPDKKGRIVPDQFVSALKELGMGNIEKEHLILMIEALQFDEDTEDVHINIDELEEILSHYGVKIEKISNLPDSKLGELLENPSGRQPKQLSLLDEFEEKKQEPKRDPTPPTKEVKEPEKVASTNPKQEPSPQKAAEKKPSEAQISIVKLSQVSNTLKHISFRMQLNRLPKEKLSSALFDDKQKNDKPITYQELALLFKKEPFSIEEKSESILLAKFLTEPEGTENIPESQYKQLKSTPKQIVAKFLKFLDNWELFSPEDEEEFDREIAMLVGSAYEHLFEFCKKFDKTKTGVIKMTEFKNALKELGAEIPKEVFSYMQLLFYSHNNQLDSVPYEQFLNAYIDRGEEGEHSELSEEEQAKIVRHYLSMIAQNLNKLKKSVRTVFLADKKGRVSPDQFVSALKYLGMSNIEKDHLILMIEALQFDEDEGDVHINIDELEEILSHYGVKAEETPMLPDSEDLQFAELLGNSSGGHVKQISLLDELEDSEEEKFGKPKPAKKEEKKKNKEDLGHFVKGSHEYIEDYEDSSGRNSVEFMGSESGEGELEERIRVVDFYEDFRDMDHSPSAVSI
ncbi:unnamed protein product [Blepharisma stoltei]|uniref:EF-hand domain-containing protein n=1 Tax=Blepharisma stoltei TaxID=1481888 RepID=A0AAU9ITG3_9CILI|nr:unnamed protein product [Blepharisma stoltei]